MITSDPTTWPTGDKIWEICHAIAKAEGYDVPNSNPFKLNNPGDISDYRHLFTSEHHSGSDITHFPNNIIGWSCLYIKILDIARGTSSTFSELLTWEQVSKKWAVNWESWVKVVINELKVSKDSTPRNYVYGKQGG
jgi:hypothetical protein